MSISGSPIVVGIFKEEVQAKHAIDVLRSLGFGDDQISAAIWKGGWKTYRVLDHLVDMGIPEQEVSYYRAEFEAGRSIVAIRHNGRLNEALNVMLLYGTRKHRYLNIYRYASGEASNPSVFRKKLEEQVGISQSFSVPDVKDASAGHTEMAVEDEVPDWQRLLMNAGLDHVFDQLP